jgi:outer membrane protein
VRSGIEQVRALTAAERSSQLALESNQLGYQVGVRINIDVLNAAQQLFSTQRDLAKARYDVLLNGLRLRNTAGELTEAEVAKVNALLEAPRAPAVGVTTGSTFPRAPAPGAAPAASPAVPASAGSGASAAGAASSAVPGAAATGVGAAPGAEGNRGGRSSLPRTPTR